MSTLPFYEPFQIAQQPQSLWGMEWLCGRSGKYPPVVRNQEVQTRNEAQRPKGSFGTCLTGDQNCEVIHIHFKVYCNPVVTFTHPKIFLLNRHRRELESFESKHIYRRKRPKVDTLFSTLFFRRVRVTSMTQRRVENTRVHFWTFSPTSINSLFLYSQNFDDWYKVAYFYHFCYFLIIIV